MKELKIIFEYEIRSEITGTPKQYKKEVSFDLTNLTAEEVKEVFTKYEDSYSLGNFINNEIEKTEYKNG